MVTCTANSLATAAKQFESLSEAQSVAVQTYLLAVIAGGSTNPATLLAAAKCFCLGERELMQIQDYLLCTIANNTA